MKQYNEKANLLCKTVSNALSNNEFRKIIKSEALRKVDGDYDVILKSVIDKPIQTIKNGVKANGNYTIRKLLEDNKPEADNNRKSTNLFIDELVEMFPNMQIAVPLHCEEWDSDYKPIVGFIPADFDEKTTKTITGYTPAGNIIDIDAVNKPERPVIIIGLNERTHRPGDPVDAPNPTHLRGEPNGSRIHLEWDCSNATNENTKGYVIYRKAYYESNYRELSRCFGIYNRTYSDNDFDSDDDPGRLFSYYVTTFNFNDESNATNIINIPAPNAPAKVASFEAQQHSLNEIELRWSNGNEVFDHTNVYRHIINVDDDYELIDEFNHNQHYYFDHDIVPGKKVIYKINLVSGSGALSDPKYDFIRVPYRDISEYSYVYIDKIKIGDLRGIEAWICGAPEMEISWARVDLESHEVIKKDEKSKFHFDNRTTSQEFEKRKVDPWRPGIWYDAISFNVIEHDVGWGEVDLDFSVGFNKKNIAKTGLSAKGGVSWKYKIKKNDEQCGTIQLDYFAEPEQWMLFSGYEVEIHVSETSKYK